MKKNIVISCTDFSWEIDPDLIESFVVKTDGCLEVIYTEGCELVFNSNYWKKYLYPSYDVEALEKSYQKVKQLEKEVGQVN